MQNFSKIFILGCFFFVITSCEKDNLEDANSVILDEDASEIEILESTYKKTAFKEMIEVTSDDGLLKYAIQVGSFDEERFREGMKVKFKLVKKADTEVYDGAVSSKSPIENSTDDLQRLIFEIRNINDRILSNSYTLALDFTGLNLQENQSKNAKVNNYWNYELISDLRPKSLGAGRSPFATGTVDYWLGGKSCGFCSWNNWYYNNLLPSQELLFNFDDYRRGRVRADISTGATSFYFTFYH